MGAACCVAAKDRTISSRSPGEVLQRHVRSSPTWSFRWDNRVREAGEETDENWLHDAGSRNSHAEVKSGTTVGATVGSDEGSPLGCSFRSPGWRKLPLSEANAGSSRLQSSDQAFSPNNVEVKESTDLPLVSNSTPIKLSPSLPSVSSFSASPQSSQSYLLPSNSTPSRWHLNSPGHRLLHQVSDSRVPEYKSPTFAISEEPPLYFSPSWGTEFTRGSNGGSSDSWPIPALSELMNTRRERWSFDSDASGFSREKFYRFGVPSSGSASFDLQTCGICTRLLTERSLWGWSSQNIMSNHEISVVSVLTCGHVYHAECLDNMTPELNKYDPACPVCTFGEKHVVKMSEKAPRVELDSKARKRSRKCAVGNDHSSDVLGHNKSGRQERDLKSSCSSSGRKSTMRKPFLKRHFSFGTRTSSSMSVKKGFFWIRSSKN